MNYKGPGPVATQFFADMKPSLDAKQMDQPGQVVTEVLGVLSTAREWSTRARLLLGWAPGVHGCDWQQVW
jgi:hypothetical protein